MARLSSMTGFARVEGRRDAFTWCWELKSVNGRSFDLRLRMPAGFDAIEQKLKAKAGEALRRGTISATLTVVEINRPPALRVNEAVLEQAVRLLESVRARVAADPPRLDGLLALPGVLEVDKSVTGEDEQAARVAEVDTSFDAALLSLVTARDAEGGRIADILTLRLDEIERLIGAAGEAAALQPEALRSRFLAQIEKLLVGMPPVTEERLAQEVAFIIQKADVREELDRLTAHVAAARELLSDGTGVGRRLDFLCQEFNREGNTICSKSADLGLTRIGLDLKAAIEQFREQIQNVE